jgi:uracil-DNA glycosylase
MGWTERQRLMLQGMGLRTWAPQDAHEPASAAPAPTDLPAARPVRADAAPGHGAPSPTAPHPNRAAVAEAPAPMPAAAPGGVQPLGTLSWDELPAAVAACQACGLCATRQRTVAGAGPVAARWAVVCEAPDGADEASGEPLSGPAGQLLDNMLRAVGLSRSAAAPAQQVFITPALKCRPPRDRKPEAAELAACAPFLAQQLALVQPQVILAMGRVAIRQLLGSDEPLGRLRGQVHQRQGLPVIATYDPVYLLRNPGDKAKAWDDLCLAASVVAAAKAAAH